MRSWMIGLLVGIFLISFSSRLLSLYLVGCIAMVSIAVLYGRRRWLAWFLSGLCCGVVVGSLYGQQWQSRRLPEACVKEPLTLVGHVASLPETTVLARGVIRQRFQIDVESIAPQQCSGPTTVILSYYGEEDIQPGQLRSFSARLKLPWGIANPGSYNLQAWYAQNQVDAIGSTGHMGEVVVEGTGRPGGYLHQQLRRIIGEAISRTGLDEDAVSLLQAVAIADRQGIDRQLWSLFQSFGIGHLLVISGLHVGLSAGLGFIVGKGLARLILVAGRRDYGRLLPGVLALISASLYASLAGFSLSTMRALVMLYVILVAAMVGRTSGAWNRLLLAMAVIVILNPLSPLGSGFWMSFAAVAGLYWLSLWQLHGEGWLKRTVMTHGVMSLLMFPLGGILFGGVSRVAALANFVMIPLMSLWIVPLILAGMVVYFFWGKVGHSLWFAAGWPLQQLLGPAKLIADSGVNVLYAELFPSPVDAVLGVIGVLLLVAAPGRRLSLVAILLLVPLFLPPTPDWDRDRYVAKLSVLDVGQGTAVVLQGRHHTLVYDTGGGDPLGGNMAEYALLPYLRREGVTSLDTLIISHPDNDHSAGAAKLFNSIDIQSYLFGGESVLPVPGRHCRAGQAWRWSRTISFQVLSPTLPKGTSSQVERNNLSCVLRVQIGRHTFLLPGDIEAAQEKEMVRYWRDDLQSDWLLAGHHGSATSTSLGWLKYVRPEIVVFSAGYANPFGHPHPDVLKRATALGYTTYNTSKSGALEFLIDGKGEINVRQYRPENLYYWQGEG